MRDTAGRYRGARLTCLTQVRETLQDDGHDRARHFAWVRRIG